MLTIAICDDNLLFAGQALTAMDKILETHAVPHQISTFQSGKALLAGGFFDIVFLDIQMEGKNGLEIAQILRREKNPCHIIFLTSHKEYVFAAFDVSATHYLLKPMDIDKLGAVLMGIVGQLTAETQQCYTVKCGSQVHTVPFAKIQFVEVLGRKISLHTEEKVYSFNGRLDEVAQAFPPRFFRCHKSYLINLSSIIKYDKETALVQGGKSVPLARRKFSAFGKAFLEFLREKGGI